KRAVVVTKRTGGSQQNLWKTGCGRITIRSTHQKRRAYMRPEIIVDIIRNHDGEFPFSDLLRELSTEGFDCSAGRELIWRGLAMGLIEFNADRSALRILEADEGKVA